MQCMCNSVLPNGHEKCVNEEIKVVLPNGPIFHFKWVHVVRIKTYQCMARCKKS